MVEYPDVFLALAREAAVRFRNSPEQAAISLEGELLKPERSELLASIQNALMRSACLEAIYRCRSTENKAISVSVPVSVDRQPATAVSRGAAADVATASYLDMNVCGRRLGDLLGSELDEASAKLRANGNGILMRAKLLTAIRHLVPDDKHVQDCISNEKIGELDEQIKGKAKAKKTSTGGSASGHRIAAAKA